MKSGIELMAEERQRQIEKEGYNSEHDDLHTDGELVRAAIAYLAVSHDYEDTQVDEFDDFEARVAKELHPILKNEFWPFNIKEFKRSDRLPDWHQTPTKDLIKAGGLIAAELDRRNNTPK